MTGTVGEREEVGEVGEVGEGGESSMLTSSTSVAGGCAEAAASPLRRERTATGAISGITTILDRGTVNTPTKPAAYDRGRGGGGEMEGGKETEGTVVV